MGICQDVKMYVGYNLPSSMMRLRACWDIANIRRPFQKCGRHLAFFKMLVVRSALLDMYFVACSYNIIIVHSTLCYCHKDCIATNLVFF